jgi:hypothetical protein
MNLLPIIPPPDWDGNGQYKSIFLETYINYTGKISLILLILYIFYFIYLKITS